MLTPHQAKALIGHYVICNRARGRGHRATQPCKLVSVNARKLTAVVRPKNNHGRDEVIPLRSLKRWIKGEEIAKSYGMGRQVYRNGPSA